jgi:predicted phosphodiesterase
MKIQILNDLHTEFADFSIHETDADVLVLAGDIGVGLGGIEWLHEQGIYKPIIYVPGNHEFYHHDICMVDGMRSYAKPNIYILDNDAVEIGGVRFLGATLWTDFALFGKSVKYLAMQYARMNIADFSLIRNKGKSFTPEDSIALHKKSKGWLECTLSESFEGKTVVVTHHAPSFGSIHPRFAKDTLTAAFVSNLEDMMDGERISVWIHGHTHNNFDYRRNGTRVICNPRGYVPYENLKGFNPALVIEV